MGQGEHFQAIEKANEHNTSVTAATDILTTALSPLDDKGVSLFRIQVAMDTAGVFSARVTKSATTVGVDFNSGSALTANALYQFDLWVHENDTVNFRHSANAIMLLLRVSEVLSLGV